MEEAVKQVADDILITKSKKTLIHIIYLSGTIIFLLGSVLLSIKIRSAMIKDNEIKDNIYDLKQDINDIKVVVVDGFASQGKEIRELKEHNEIQFKGIDKKFEILKKGQDESTRNQMQLVDELINMKGAISINENHPSPPIKELESKYSETYRINNDIYQELKVSRDTIKKNIN